MKRIRRAVAVLVVAAALIAGGWIATHVHVDSGETVASVPASSTAAVSSAPASPTGTATVTVEGTGTATDVTITVLDSDTGLTATDGAEGLNGTDSTPTTSDVQVGDQAGQVVQVVNASLPLSKTVEVEPGQTVTVTAQNGTGGGEITVTIATDGQTVTDSASGFNAVAETATEVQ